MQFDLLINYIVLLSLACYGRNANGNETVCRETTRRLGHTTMPPMLMILKTKSYFRIWRNFGKQSFDRKLHAASKKI